MDKYELIAGERRWLASQNAGLHEVPVVILNVDDVKSLEFAIVENVSKKRFKPYRRSTRLSKINSDFNYNQEKLISIYWKKQKLYSKFFETIISSKRNIINGREGVLSAGHARTLVGLNNSIDIAKKIVQKKLSVRQTEILSSQFRNKNLKLVSKKDANILELQRVLEEKTGLVFHNNNKKNNSGSIILNIMTLDQLDKLINTIKNKTTSFLRKFFEKKSKISL